MAYISHRRAPHADAHVDDMEEALKDLNAPEDGRQRFYADNFAELMGSALEALV